ncbi:MAG: crotonase/enoyl-CoA hydratase family protein [Hoeflea sp.]|uniref:crotonase/enoyl-CoA hydratase family protein n=1 Tax=Hoeflea sp. TaxID=1940281 RepID=UPI001DFFD55F|nr:crotonase/enoyl-CoA hydratase family protein [Hoeflea sp.]MBU4527707.1 crotonase/enoyl-CoA hydratase family protein [Alphaproteobacteria bacterium]MBU4546425.1 crotonase/enoyl-CoA hydratase family protein [Alphaproteobacteria bacterium]MBU4553057.1 crotonase/enoyl-CoA hydratase family protein [Alphaproteobacteria bacterium]MBV1724129.1 crotonase/enoyl-CoA hydratase family protein [Hoeflea sp.]MBV1759814.1 crotonase/enoyl-CoA hydratase family protein [Hoeflea sp.]
MTDHILIDRAGETHALNVIRFNRPDKKNAITRAMYAAMAKALSDGEADDTVRAHVILGTPGAFSSGNDMQDFMAVAMGASKGEEVFDFLIALATVTKPVVSGVDGLAIGIGTTIHMHCDLTFATPASRFHTPFVDLALVPEAGSSLLAPAAMGHQKAFALLAAGLPFSGEEAERAGLIFKTVSVDELEPAVFAAAEHLAAKPPKALAIARRLIKPDPDLVTARIREEGALFAAQLKSAEALAAFQAFMARKK